ncbi:MAG: IS1096 element passenger TnpR family protein [Chloroflexota bacterium]
MPRTSTDPTYQTILNELADSLSGPIPLEDLIQQVLARKHSSAKNPRASVLNVLHSMTTRSLVFLDPATIIPARLAMQGARFRLPLGRRGAERGEIDMQHFKAYLPLDFETEKTRFVDANGNPIHAPLKPYSQKSDFLFISYEIILFIADLSAWLRHQKVTRQDDLLVTILDWNNGLFQLEIESHRKRNNALIQARDRLLADVFYAILESASYERVWLTEAIPTAYARLPEKEGCPPHHWQIVLEKDQRFRFDDYELKYADGKLSPFEFINAQNADEPLPRRLKPVAKEQKKLVYRLKAAFKHNPRIWREVEILGEHTLHDLNSILVDSFDHDFDHLAGFWKLVPRQGQKTRYREVDLGTVDPFGEGDGADVQIAAIGLKEGDRLKYVFDFGDWIEHIITLEAIHPPEEGVKYPRETARNKPSYLYCTTCKEENKKTIAVWQCLTCSVDQDQDLFYCDECITDHEDHYVEKIIY